MASEQIITQEEYLATNFNTHYRRKAEDFKEPFCSALPEVEVLGLELVSLTSFKHYTSNPTTVNKDTANKMEYSRWIRSMVYPWFYHAVYNGLSTSRTEIEKQRIIDQYFGRLQKHASEHCDYKPVIIFTKVVIKSTINILSVNKKNISGNAVAIIIKLEK
ncbi:uncharacterized protein [Argopecten irradians]|uniref:uncharacterized protein n=1 Tax=Argopecten irradians TaxID=31199 RepID=UPI003716413E